MTGTLLQASDRKPREKMRTFGTRGPVDPEKNFIVHRTDEIADFINRVKEGRYIVIFAPRQTGKTTFFQQAIDTLAACRRNILFNTTGLPSV